MNQTTPFWHIAFPASAQYTTATPVIDPNTNTIYVLTKTAGPSNGDIDSGPTYLHAIDITTGKEKSGSPVQVQATAPGTGDGAYKATSGPYAGRYVVAFDGPATKVPNGGSTFHANDRAGLLLLNGVVYTAFAFNSDANPYHGWILGYQYDGTKFTQKYVFCTTPNGSEATDPNGGDGGIWQAGKGLMADASGNIYCSVGNGTFDANTGGIDYGMCYLKLTPNPNTNTLTVASYYAPYDEAAQSKADQDDGNSGPVGIPGTTSLFAGATKFGAGFLLNSTSLGGFPADAAHETAIQRLNGLSGNDEVGQNPIAFDTGSGGYKYVYLWPSGHNIRQLRYDPSVSNFNPPSPPTNTSSFPGNVYKQTSNQTAGGSLAISSNGVSNPVLWAVGPSDSGSATVHALNATDVSQPEFWNSGMNASRDALSSTGHFQFPTVADGRLFVPTGSQSIAVYGLRWLMTDPGIGHVIGRANSGGWSANTAQDPTGFLQYGPYTRVLDPGSHMASWDLLVDNNTFTGDPGPVLELQVSDLDKGQSLLAVRDVYRHEWTGVFQYQDFAVPFTLPASDVGDRLEFRVYWYRHSYVRERDVMVQ